MFEGFWKGITFKQFYVMRKGSACAALRSLCNHEYEV